MTALSFIASIGESVFDLINATFCKKKLLIIVRAQWIQFNTSLGELSTEICSVNSDQHV
jgi:hypothetical protein